MISMLIKTISGRFRTPVDGDCLRGGLRSHNLTASYLLLYFYGILPLAHRILHLREHSPFSFLHVPHMYSKTERRMTHETV